jgi:hypothetical protein
LRLTGKTLEKKFPSILSGKPGSPADIPLRFTAGILYCVSPGLKATGWQAKESFQYNYLQGERDGGQPEA